MNELVLKNETMTSLQIAEVTGKNHKEVLRAIRNMEPAWEKTTQRKFALSEYIDTSGKKNPCYELNKTECLYIATKFNDEARAKLVLRWEQLEKEKQLAGVPQNFAQALYLAAQQQEQIQHQQLALNEQKKTIAEMTAAIGQMSEKVSYVDRILQSKTTMTVTSIAQDYGMSAKAFNVLLRNCGIQHKVDRQWILYAKYIREGYVQSRTYEFSRKDGRTDVLLITEWTQKGRLFLYNILKERGTLPLIERTAQSEH